MMARGAPQTESAPLVARLRNALHPLTGSARDYDPLLERIGDARFVLIGEASHGTHEFYRERAAITRRLIVEKGFGAVAVEADWPDARRVHRYVRGEGGDREAAEALADFARFPAWMWRNADVLEFIGWLRHHNDTLPGGAQPVGFYGLDLYSLFSSIRAVIDYLDRIDPDAAQRARYRYACFDHFAEDPQAYGYTAALSLTRRCRDEVAGQLAELHRLEAEYVGRDGREAEDAFFSAEQNARLASSAEAYYRTLFGGRISSWNLRDRHMAETLAALDDHLRRNGRPARVAVWAHNSHLGDARATEMAGRGELNLGQLARERYGRDAVLIGLTTHHGTVTAAGNWDEPARLMRVRPALPGSYEALFHALGVPDFLLISSDAGAIMDPPAARLERAIGVVYRPETERTSHYFEARLAQQFDAVLHFDQTRGVEPIDRAAPPQAGQAEETFPYGV